MAKATLQAKPGTVSFKLTPLLLAKLLSLPRLVKAGLFAPELTFANRQLWKQHIGQFPLKHARGIPTKAAFRKWAKDGLRQAILPPKAVRPLCISQSKLLTPLS